LNRVKRKDDSAFLDFWQHPGTQQDVNLSRDGFYMAAYPAGGPAENANLDLEIFLRRFTG
jgi:hypothetical protein